MNDEKLLTTAEVAEILAISNKSVLDLVHAGELPFIPIGTGSIRPRMRFERRDIDDFIKRRKTRRMSPAPGTTRRVSYLSHPPAIGFMERRQLRENEKHRNKGGRKNG